MAAPNWWLASQNVKGLLRATPKNLAIFCCFSVESPRSAHELHKVIVVVDGCGHSSVVLVPLGAGNDSVAVSVSEVSQEFKEHFVLGHFARLHFRVHRCVVDSSQVRSLNCTAAVSVKLKECFVHHSLAFVVEGSSDGNEEFVEVHMTIFICVEESQERVGFGLSDIDLNLSESAEEFLGINFLVSVEGVEVSEGAAQSSDCSRSASM